LKKQVYINATCSIDSGKVVKNGISLYEHAAALSDLLPKIYKHFSIDYPKFYKMDNLAKLGWLSAELLLRDSFPSGAYRQEDVGVILANASSSLDDDLKYYATAEDLASPSLFVYTLPNIVTGEICIRHHFKGEQAFYIMEAFDSSFIAQQVQYLMQTDIFNCCVCGWVEVLDGQYQSMLFLVEKIKRENGVIFSAKSMDSAFNSIIN
jgi:hypothetical protein